MQAASRCRLGIDARSWHSWQSAARRSQGDGEHSHLKIFLTLEWGGEVGMRLMQVAIWQCVMAGLEGEGMVSVSGLVVRFGEVSDWKAKSRER